MSDESLVSVPFGIHFRGVEWVHEMWAVVVLEVKLWRCYYTDVGMMASMLYSYIAWMTG